MPRELIAASPREENIASVGRFSRLLADAFHGLGFRGRLQVGLPEPSVRVRVLFADELPADAAARRRYLLWRMAEGLDVRPKDARLSSMALPSPLPGHRHVVLCAAIEEKVVQQYERALAESKVRNFKLTPSAVLLFNLFDRHLTADPAIPQLFVVATEPALTSIITLRGCPVFWRTRRVSRQGEGPAPGADWRLEVLRDVDEAVRYGEEALGVDGVGRVLLTGPQTDQPGLAEWLAHQSGLPVAVLDAGGQVRRAPKRLVAEGWNRWGVALGAARA